MNKYKTFAEYCSNINCNTCPIYKINQGYECDKAYQEIIKNKGKIIIDISKEVEKEGN